MPSALLLFLVMFFGVVAIPTIVASSDRKIGVSLLIISASLLLWFIFACIKLNIQEKEQFISESQKVNINGKIVDVVYDNEKVINVTKLVPYNIEKSVKVYKTWKDYNSTWSLGVDFLTDCSIFYIIKEDKVEK
jgi:hypothetical protein